MSVPSSLPFIDLGAQRHRMGEAIEEAILRVVRHGAYILGPEVVQLEAELSAYCGAAHAISCANGTDALSLVLMAKGVGPGQAVLCPSFTFAATAEVVALRGATPVFVDIHEDTFNIDPASLEAALATARRSGLDPVGVIAVDLFGQPADYDAIEPLCDREGLWLLCDAAQSFGASYKGTRLGRRGLATTTSFFPAKPLGCYGDGGAVLTDDPELTEIMLSLRVHGQGTDKYDNVRIGMNGRLDTIQAAVLLEKLRIFDDEISARNRVAARYATGLGKHCICPPVLDDCISTWAQYTIRVRPEQRDLLAQRLREQGIPTAVYYPKPLHRQTAYRHYPVGRNGLPVSDRVADQVISLPMHGYLQEADQDRIVHAIAAVLSS